MKINTKRKFFIGIVLFLILITILLVKKFNSSFIIGIQTIFHEETFKSFISFLSTLFAYCLLFNILYSLSYYHVAKLIDYTFEEKAEHKIINIGIISSFLMIILFIGNLSYSYIRLNQCWITTIGSLSYIANLPSYKISDFARNCQIRKDNENKEFYSSIAKYCKFSDFQKKNATIEELKEICKKNIKQETFSIIENTENKEIIERAIELEKNFLKEMEQY